MKMNFLNTTKRVKQNRSLSHKGLFSPHPSSLRPSERGFALVWWALFIGFVAFPLLVLVVEGGRYFRAAGDVQKAADAAAEAAVREVDIEHYINTGEVRFGSSVYATAHEYANQNAAFLRPHGTDVAIVAIQLDEANNTVLVTARADVTLLFPHIAPQILIQRTGVAQVRLTGQ
jgi:hypothetical protein